MKKRILVVAHEADVVEAIPITLELAGHQVILADCGFDAILWAERFLPDLILVDISLADMDGSTLIGILQRLPSTAALGSILLKPRRHDAPTQARFGRPEISSFNSSELLMQVAHTLTLCHAMSYQSMLDEQEKLAAGEGLIGPPGSGNSMLNRRRTGELPTLEKHLMSVTLVGNGPVTL